MRSACSWSLNEVCPLWLLSILVYTFSAQKHLKAESTGQTIQAVYFPSFHKIVCRWCWVKIKAWTLSVHGYMCWVSRSTTTRESKTCRISHPILSWQPDLWQYDLEGEHPLLYLTSTDLLRIARPKRFFTKYVVPHVLNDLECTPA